MFFRKISVNLNLVKQRIIRLPKINILRLLGNNQSCNKINDYRATKHKK